MVHNIFDSQLARDFRDRSDVFVNYLKWQSPLVLRSISLFIIIMYINFVSVSVFKVISKVTSYMHTSLDGGVTKMDSMV